MNRASVAISISMVWLWAGCGSSGALVNQGEKTGETANALKVCAAGPTVSGIDVSYYQGTIDWQAVANGGVQFAIARINDGSFNDPQFGRNWDQIKANGLIRGAYQFFEPNDDAAWQASVAVNAVGRLGDGDLPVMLDVEWTSGSPTVAELTTWLDAVEAGTGKRPMIYTAVGYWNQYFNGQFGDYPLVVANYGVSCPNLPDSWSDWQFWQWGGAGVPGISGDVDQDVFNGTLDQLKAFAGAASTTGGGGGEPNIGLALNADGRIEAFARGPQGNILHSWQTGPNGSWSPFGDLGGLLGGEPIAAANQDGRLEMFAVGTDGHSYHQWQTSPGGGWSGWADLGGVARPQIAVASNSDGRLELFVIGSDAQLWHQWQLEPNGNWSGFSPMGGQVLDSVSVAANQDGRLEVFVRGTDGQLWHQWQTADGWSGFWPMGGQWASDAAVGRNADGRLEVFAVGTDGQVWHAWQTAPNGGWSDFYPMGGSADSKPAVGNNQDGRLEVFVRGTDGNLQHAWQTPDGAGGWSGFWGYPALTLASAPSVINDQDGRLEVFVRGPFGGVFHVWQTEVNGGWSDWAALGN